MTRAQSAALVVIVAALCTWAALALGRWGTTP